MQARRDAARGRLEEVLIVAMAELAMQPLFQTATLAVRDFVCDGGCASEAECAHATSLAFPYRGVYVRHLGRQEAVAEANQMVAFNADEDYRITHPVPGGDACLSLALGTACWRSWRRGTSFRATASGRSGARPGASTRAPRRWWPCCGMG